MNALEYPDDAQRTRTIGVQPTRPLGAILKVVGPSLHQSTFRLTDGVCVVGSSESADVFVDDPTVSRSHLELALVAGGVSVRDLGSRNGTFYLGQRVDRIVLVHGASVSIGASRIVIEPDLEDLSRQPFNGDVYRGLVGCSPAMRSMFAMLTRLEGSRVTVHVTGESGVGKELVARAIHDGSGVTGPLVTVNCGAISRELVASELFGHKRGAFTGALESRKGAFESADGGTLFLDEVGELPLDVQPMLLRALETGEVRPVGGDRVGTFSVRVISATHRDLEKEVRRGRFREDLFYRLAVIKLVVPPLRERIEDIEVLARRFASALGVDLPPPALEEIKRRPWPGNARELRNVVQAYSVLLAIPPAAARENTELDAAIGAFVDVARPYAELKEQLLDRFQHAYLEQLLARVRGNQSAAAKLSGLDRTYLGRLLARYGLARHCV